MITLNKQYNAIYVSNDSHYIGMKTSDGSYHSEIWRSKWIYHFNLTPKYLRVMKRVGMIPDYIPIEQLIRNGRFIVTVRGNICFIFYNDIPVWKYEFDETAHRIRWDKPIYPEQDE